MTVQRALFLLTDAAILAEVIDDSALPFKGVKYEWVVTLRASAAERIASERNCNRSRRRADGRTLEV